jgi:hypothetical protein
MRETRLSGSEGGARFNPCPYPYPRPTEIRLGWLKSRFRPRLSFYNAALFPLSMRWLAAIVPE